MDINQNPNIMTITPLGSGQEVGRSCILMRYKGKSIMFDCGLHMGYEQQSSLPFFDKIPKKQDGSLELDLILITHFHLDHCAALPYFLKKCDFRGQVYMTSPTRALYRHQVKDSLGVKSENIQLYSEQDVENSMRRIEFINYHQELTYNGIKFTCYCAGHVLGAAMFQVEVDGVKVLYTGDYSTEQERLIMPAEIPNDKIDVLIVESTYGKAKHEPRALREARFTKAVHDIVRNGGKCLLPIIASGRAEELLLILEEYWESHPDLKNSDASIHITSALFQKFKEIFEYYINLTPKRNTNLKNLHHAPNQKTKVEQILNIKDKPVVVLACPGMLQSGISRQLYERWCEDDRNGVILTGYCVDGTLADKIKNNSNEKFINSEKREVKPVMQVQTISFSAHADFDQTCDFIDKIQPDYVVLVHGNYKKVMELQKSLQEKFRGKIKKIVAPGNTVEEIFTFDSKRSCKIIGKLQREVDKEMNDFINGVKENQKQLESSLQNFQENKKILLETMNNKEKQLHEIQENEKQLQEIQENEKQKEINIKNEETNNQEIIKPENQDQQSEQIQEENQQQEDLQEIKQEETLQQENQLEEKEQIKIEEEDEEEQQKGENIELEKQSIKHILIEEIENLKQQLSEVNKKIEEIQILQQEKQFTKELEFDAVFVQDDENYVLMNGDDKSTSISPQQIALQQKLRIQYVGGLELIKFFCQQILFDGEIKKDDNGEYVHIQSGIRIQKIQDEKMIEVSWNSSIRNDLIVDNLAILLQQFSEDESLDIFQKNQQSQNGMEEEKSSNENIFEFIKNNYPKSNILLDDGIIVINSNNIHIATIDLKGKEIFTEDEEMKLKLKKLINF